jgi:hypothetical protein
MGELRALPWLYRYRSTGSSVTKLQAASCQTARTDTSYYYRSTAIYEYSYAVRLYRYRTYVPVPVRYYRYRYSYSYSCTVEP